MKKKKNEKPKLWIIDLTQENEVVECQLETAKNHTVNFKFNCDDDKPEEIAENLVSFSYRHPYCLSVVQIQPRVAKFQVYLYRCYLTRTRI